MQTALKLHSGEVLYQKCIGVLQFHVSPMQFRYKVHHGDVVWMQFGCSLDAVWMQFGCSLAGTSLLSVTEALTNSQIAQSAHFFPKQIETANWATLSGDSKHAARSSGSSPTPAFIESIASVFIPLGVAHILSWLGGRALIR